MERECFNCSWLHGSGPCCDQPPPLTTDSSGEAKKEFEMCDRSNCMNLMIIKSDIPETFRGIVSEEVTTAKEFLDNIEKHFVKNDKV